jgi:hypothetical protein
MPAKPDLYTRAHLIVAAIRVLTHLQPAPPSVDAVCRHLQFSTEEGHLLCRKLAELEIIEVLEGAFGTRLCVRDFARLETLPRDEGERSMEEELRRFHDARAGLNQKIASIQAEQARKKKDLFAELERKLKRDRGAAG